MKQELRTQTSVGIRLARASDAEAVASLSRELGYENSLEEMHDRLQRLDGNPDHVVFVACTSDRNVVGWVDVYVSFHLQTGASAEIGGLVVGEGARSRGVGRLLVAQAETWARSKGMTHMRVRSNVKRSEAHRFYERENYIRSKTSAVFDKEL